MQLNFAELCEGTTSVVDLLELADRYRTLVLADVPPLATVAPDARRRFGNLVDVLWDRDVRLVVLAAGARSLVLDADLTDHARTSSRLELLRTIQAAAAMSDRPPDTRVVQDVQAHPWAGFALAADAAVHELGELGELGEHIPMDLWLVTHVTGPDQRVVASHGDWDSIAPPGAAFPWAESFRIHMLDGQPGVAPDVRAVPLYRRPAVGPLSIVRCSVGVPLVDGDGLLFGSLCGFAGSPRPEAFADAHELVRFVGRMLSTVLAREAAAAERSAAAADAYAQVDRDALTGLANRGWQSALAVEQERCQRFGSAASVVTVSVDVDANDEADAPMRAAAGALSAACRPTDTTARVTATRLAAVAVGADVVSARARAGHPPPAPAAHGGGARPGRRRVPTYGREPAADLAPSRRRSRGGRPRMMGAEGPLVDALPAVTVRPVWSLP